MFYKVNHFNYFAKSIFYNKKNIYHNKRRKLYFKNIFDYISNHKTKFRFTPDFGYGKFLKKVKRPFYLKRLQRKKKQILLKYKYRLINRNNLLFCNNYYIKLYSMGFFKNAALQYYTPTQHHLMPRKSKTILYRTIKSLKYYFYQKQHIINSKGLLGNYVKQSLLLPNINNYISYFNTNKNTLIKNLKKKVWWSRKSFFLYRIHNKWNNLNLLYIDRFRQYISITTLFKFKNWYSVSNYSSNRVKHINKYNISRYLNYNKFKHNLKNVLDIIKCYNILDNTIYYNLFKYKKNNLYLNYLNRKTKLTDFNFMYNKYSTTQLSDAYYTKKQVSNVNTLQLNQYKNYLFNTYLKDTSFFYNLSIKSFSYTNHFDEKYKYLSTNYINNKLLLKKHISLNMSNRKVSFFLTHPFIKLLSNTNVCILYKFNKLDTFFYNHFIFKYLIFILKDNNINFFKDYIIKHYVFFIYYKYLNLNNNTLKNIKKHRNIIAFDENFILINKYESKKDLLFLKLRKSISHFSLAYMHSYIYIYKYINQPKFRTKNYMYKYNNFYKKKTSSFKEITYLDYFFKKILSNEKTLNNFLKKLRNYLNTNNSKFNNNWTLKARKIVLKYFKEHCFTLLKDKLRYNSSLVNKIKVNVSNKRNISTLSNTFLKNIVPIYKKVISKYSKNNFYDSYYRYISSKRTKIKKKNRIFNKYIINKKTNVNYLLQYINLLYKIKNSNMYNDNIISNVFFYYNSLKYIKFKDVYIKNIIYDSLDTLKTKTTKNNNNNYLYEYTNKYNTLTKNISEYMFLVSDFNNIIKIWFYYLKQVILVCNLLNSYSKFREYLFVNNLDVNSFFIFKDKNSTDYNINSLLELNLKSVLF